MAMVLQSAYGGAQCRKQSVYSSQASESNYEENQKNVVTRKLRQIALLAWQLHALAVCHADHAACVRGLSCRVVGDAMRPRTTIPYQAGQSVLQRRPPATVR
eukprot:6188836-Pleurochrysis_carterae.AAC.2